MPTEEFASSKTPKLANAKPIDPKVQAVRKLAQAMDRFFGTGSALRFTSSDVVYDGV